MLWGSKLKGPIGRIYPITIFSFYMLGVIEYLIRRQLGLVDFKGGGMPYITMILAGLFFAGMGVYQLYRYRLWINFWLNLLLAIGPWHNTFVYKFPFLSGATILIILFVIGLFVLVFWSVIYRQERFQVNSRRLLKLSATFVDEDMDGFTERPFSAGKINTFKRFGEYYKQGNEARIITELQSA